MNGRSAIVKEAAVERALFERVTARGGVCIKVQALGVRGFFDRIILLPGPRVIFAEIKRPRRGRLSPHQKQYIALFEALGVDVVIIRESADIDRLLAAP
jgi:hypothetical protein